MSVARLVLLAASCAVPACLVDGLDPAPSGVFACGDDDECGDGQSCIFSACHDAMPPEIEIRSPEADEVVIARPGDPPGMLTLTISVGGASLDLVPSSGDATVGEGHIEVVVDGQVAGELDRGNLVSGVAMEVQVPDTPGAHRILARAMRADGVPYDNDAATATRIVWVDDGLPRVALVRPWPGDAFPLVETEIEVEISTLNFSLVPVTDEGPSPSGHAHIHYDDPFPVCPDDPACDCCYIAVLGPTATDVRRASSTVRLPAAGAGLASLTAILRTTSHPAFVDAQGDFVFDTIELERSASAPANVMESDDGG